MCRHKTGGLLPRLLTLTVLPKEEGGCFLLRYSTLADSFLLGSGMLCVARTFLMHAECKRQTGQLLMGDKGTIFVAIMQALWK